MKSKILLIAIMAAALFPPLAKCYGPEFAEQGDADLAEAAVVNYSVGPEISISPPAAVAAGRYMPDIAFNGRQIEYRVVWHNKWPGSRDVYARRVAANGKLLSWFDVSNGWRPGTSSA